MNVDTRWSDPEKLPLSNGPITFRTPPARPAFCLAGDGTQIRYHLSYPMHIVDDNPWRPLQFQIANSMVSISKPVAISTSTSPGLDTESPDHYWTSLTISCHQPGQLTPLQGWEVAHKFLSWLRIKCRHYWLLHGTIGFEALYRTTIFERRGQQVSQQHSVAYGNSVIVRPLTEELWNSCQAEMTLPMAPPLSDALYCDALLSLCAGDIPKAVVEAAVASEIAITQLLTDVATQLPNTPDRAAFLSKEASRAFPRFHQKLKQWPARLGLQSAQTYCPAGFPSSWVTDTENLYQERNSVAHSGSTTDVTSNSSLSKLVFAANATLEYCRDQRLQQGLPVYAMPHGHSPFQQTIAFTDGALNSITNQVNATLNQ